MLGLRLVKSHQRLVAAHQVVRYLSSNEVSEIIQTHIGLNDAAISAMPKKTVSKLETLSRFHLERNCALCKNINMEDSKCSVLPSLLYQHPLKVAHKIMMLQELGNTRPTLQHLGSLFADMNRTVMQFKKNQNIKPDSNIAEHVFAVIGKPQTILSSWELPEHIPMYLYYSQLLLYFKTWILNLPKSKSYKINVKTRCLSFRMIQEMQNVLLNEAGIEKEYINSHPNILHYCPTWTRKLFSEFKDLRIGDMSFIEVVKKRPGTLTSDPEHMKGLLKLLKEQNMPEASITSCLAILNIRPDVFQQRQQEYYSIPELDIWRKHPRWLYLICHYRIVMHRLNYLQLTNRLSHTSVHLLSASRPYFLRFLKGEATIMAFSKHIRYILEAELGEIPNNVLAKITRHPFWRTASFIDMSKMLRYLKEKYTAEDIYHGIFLIFYPPETAIKMLEAVEKEYGEKNGYNYTPRQLLVLCVYLMEKENHFTGDAIWRIETPQPIIYDSAIPMAKKRRPSSDTSENEKEQASVLHRSNG